MIWKLNIFKDVFLDNELGKDFALNSIYNEYGT